MAVISPIAMHGVVHALLGALLIGALNTLGDLIWANFIPAHRPVFGILHGVVLCLGIGLYLGVLRQRPVRGAVEGALTGFVAASGFYVFAPFIGYSAMFVLWMALWVAFGIIEGRVLGEPRVSLREAVGRGVLAAVGSGAAFYAISGIWQRHPSGAADYAFRFVCWTFAFLPGFLALLARRR